MSNTTVGETADCESRIHQMQSEKMMLNERRQRMWEDRVATAEI